MSVHCASISITILNTALNVAVGRFFLLAVLFAFEEDIAEVMFVKLPLYKPVTIHADFPSLSFCNLAMLPEAYTPGCMILF